MDRNTHVQPSQGAPSLKPGGEVVLVLDALSARFGGTAYAMIELAGGLAERSDVERVHVVTQLGSLVERGLRTRGTAHLVTPRPWPPSELAWRIAWEAARLPRLAKHVGADAVLTSSGMLSRIPTCPVISLLSNPVPFIDRRAVGNRLRRWAIACTSRHARAVYVPSRYMGELVGFEENVKVVPWGVDRATFHPGGPPGNEVLYVSDFYPHKRHELVLAAWRRLSPPRPVLRFIGDPAVAPGWFEHLRRDAAADGVHVDGHVSLDELVSAYRRARVLVIASERESFSMPVAEALACGTPVIVRDLPSLRETAGPGALVVSGDDPILWAEAIRRALNDDALHASLRAAGLAHASRFSWDRFAAELLADVRSGIAASAPSASDAQLARRLPGE